MNNAHTRDVLTGGRTGSGDAAAPGMAGWLSLAAAPTFAIMALISGVFGGAPDMLCMTAHDPSPLTGMVAMYMLMSVFHAAPWLKLLRAKGAEPRH